MVALLIQRDLAEQAVARLHQAGRPFRGVEQVDARLEARAVAFRHEIERGALLGEGVVAHAGEAIVAFSVEAPHDERRILAPALVGEPVGLVGQFILSQRVDPLLLPVGMADQEPVHRQRVLLGLREAEGIHRREGRGLCHEKVIAAGREAEIFRWAVGGLLVAVGRVKVDRRVALPGLHLISDPFAIVGDGLLCDPLPGGQIGHRHGLLRARLPEGQEPGGEKQLKVSCLFHATKVYYILYSEGRR